MDRELEAAEAGLQSLEQLARGTVGTGDSLVGQILWERARNQIDGGQLERAVPSLERALKCLTDSLGAYHLDTLRARTDLALTLVYDCRPEEGERRLSSLLADLEQNIGPDHSATLTALRSMAVLRETQDRNDEALRLVMEAHRRAKDAPELGPRHDETRHAARQLYGVLRGLKRYDEALRLAEESLGATERRLEPDHPHVLGGRRDVADLLICLGRIQEASSMVETALVAVEAGASEPGLHSHLLGLLGRIRATQGRFRDAEALCHRAIDAVSVLGPGADSFARFELAQVLHAMGRDEDAERELLGSMEHVRECMPGWRERAELLERIRR